jgi:hypothetical protein
VMSGWRRILVLLAVGAVGSLAALSISTSLALFSATGVPADQQFRRWNRCADQLQLRKLGLQPLHVPIHQR